MTTKILLQKKLLILLTMLLALLKPHSHNLGGLGNSDYLTKYNTATSTASAYFNANPSYVPSYPATTDPSVTSQTNYVMDAQISPGVYGNSVVSSSTTYYWTDPNTGIRYSKNETHDWR